MSRRSKIIVSVVGAAITAMIFYHMFGAPIADRVVCRNQLSCLGFVIRFYRDTHSGSYPSKLEDIEKGLLNGLLHCPGPPSQTQTIGKSPHENDYVYVYWPQLLSDSAKTLPGGYPIVYDAKLSNHNGKGINILLVDGSVIWDERARWLTHFAVEHPEIILPDKNGTRMGTSLISTTPAPSKPPNHRPLAAQLTPALTLGNAQTWETPHAN
jgi:prepilin-type processing-associated H-X9-DG protein